MSDVKCVVCGEPWDYYGMLHGDMLKWESELFRKGAGCPCCKGVIPEGGAPRPETLEDIENGDGDPIERLMLMENVEKRPEWIRPKDPVLWTCKGCGVEVIRNVDNDKIEYHLPHDAKAMKWYHSHDFSSGEPTEEPAHIFKPDEPVCEFCLRNCSGCGVPVCSLLDYGDGYDGYCGITERYGCGVDAVFCTGCLEIMCAECGGLPDDCDCCRDCSKQDCQCETCGECGEKLESESGCRVCECERCEHCGCLIADCECPDMSSGDEENDE